MNVAALLHDAPSDDHRTRNDVALHQHQQQPPQPPSHQHDHRFPPPPYPHLPSPASIIGLDDSRYDPRPPTRDRDRDRERDRMLPPPHHPHSHGIPYQHQHPLHFPPPHHQQHVIPPQPPMLPPPPPHHSHQIHHHVYDYPHDARVKHPLTAPSDRERLDRPERDRFPGPPSYPSDQGRITPVTVMSSRDRDPGLRREPHIAPEPVMASLREREREKDRERERDRAHDRDRDRDSPPPGHSFMSGPYGHHTPFSPNPHGPMTQPLPPPLALAPHQPKRRRDNATPVEGPFVSDRDRDRAADTREMVRERERDRQAREASLRDRDAGKVKRDRERDRERVHHSKHPSLEERQPATGSTLPLHPSHAPLVQRPPASSQQAQPHHVHSHSKPSAFLVPNVPQQPQTLPLAPPHHASSKKLQQQQLGPVHAQSINVGPGTHQHHAHSHHSPFQSQPQPQPQPHYSQSQPPSRVLTHVQPSAPPPLPRSPSPPALQPPFDLGTFVLPRTPFPYFFPPERDRDVALRGKGDEKQENEPIGPVSGKEDVSGQRKERERERDIVLTVLIPRKLLPSHIPDPLPLFGGGTAGGLTRRVYTDDSPIVLCALHAGFVTWSEVCTARDQRPGRDLKVRVRVRREGMGERGEWCGGPSAAGEAVASAGISGRPSAGKRKGKERERTDESVGLVSRAWPAPHDGSGVEILSVEWIPNGMAHMPHFPNRRARLAQYAKRRQELMTVYEGAGEVGQKRGRKLPNAVALEPILEEPEEQLQGCSLVWGRAGADVGFKFDPEVVRSILFPDPDPEADASEGEREHRPRKRRRMDADAASPQTNGAVETPRAPEREMILENDVDRYLVSRCAAEGVDTMDVDGTSGGGRRYKISMLPRGAAIPRPEERLEEEGVPSTRQGQDVAVNGVVPKECPVEPDGAKADTSPSEEQVLSDAAKNLSKQEAEVPSDPPEKEATPEPNGVLSPPHLGAIAVSVSSRSAETSGDEGLAPPQSEVTDAPLSPAEELHSKPPPEPPLKVVATALEEGDVGFLPDGITIARRRVVGEPNSEADEAHSKRGWFIEVTRWRWGGA